MTNKFDKNLGDKKMNLRTIIDNALRTNPNVIIINKEISEWDIELNAKSIELIEYDIAPKKGLYLADELNNFMETLINDVKHYSITSFQINLTDGMTRNGKFASFEPFRLEMGYIQFREKIEELKVKQKGVLYTEINNFDNITNDRVLRYFMDNKFKNGKQTCETEYDYTSNFYCDVKISVFPNKTVKKMLEKNGRDSISYRILNKRFKPGIYQQVKAKKSNLLKK